MLKPRQLPILLTLLCGLAASIDAAALGFGRAPQTAVLGQPLNFAVPLHLDAGEPLTAECLNAEVMVGDNRVPPYLVRALLEAAGSDGATVRVVTTPAVDEPVVAVTITAGCVSRMSRRFVLLADPPLSAPATTPAFAAAPPPVSVVLADAGTAAPQFVAVNNRVDPGPAILQAAAVNDVPVAPAPAPATPAPAPATPARVPAKERPPAKAEPARQAARPSTAARPARKPAATPAAEPVARLQLDIVEPVADAAAPSAAAVIEEAIAVVAEAASAARASALAASAAAQRISALEQDVQSLRAQAQASNDEAARWRAQVSATSTEQRWFRPLWLAVLFLAALCAWLAWRMRVLRQADQRSWLLAAEAADKAAPATRAVTSPIPLVNSELELPPPVPRPAWPAPVPVPALEPAALSVVVTAARPVPAPVSATPVPAAPVPAPVAPAEPPTVDPVIEPGFGAASERTDVFAPNLRFDEGAARDVSIEELLDLEQQAEFFIALGQDDAAVELLVEHLRSTGGGSPLPYLKLLEIYRRRADPQAYERTRARFNDRFNAYAPDWDSDLQGGRSIEEYPGIVPRLQQAWPRPLDAMAELEALLFRKSRGELFELPAYREVLFLYSLARDLLEREPSEGGQVDILLPLFEGDTASSLAPLALDAANDHVGNRPTEPVDLDLSMPTGTDSLFGELPAGGRQR